MAHMGILSDILLSCTHIGFQLFFTIFFFFFFAYSSIRLTKETNHVHLPHAAESYVGSLKVLNMWVHPFNTSVAHKYQQSLLSNIHAQTGSKAKGSLALFLAYY